MAYTGPFVHVDSIQSAVEIKRCFIAELSHITGSLRGHHRFITGSLPGHYRVMSKRGGGGPDHGSCLRGRNRRDRKVGLMCSNKSYENVSHRCSCFRFLTPLTGVKPH